MSLKVGVVGTKGIGKIHSGCHHGNDLADLVAVCDVIRERADETAKEHGVKAYYRLADMLDAHPELDIVDVCTGGNENGGWHFEPTMEALPLWLVEPLTAATTRAPILASGVMPSDSEQSACRIAS